MWAAGDIWQQKMRDKFKLISHDRRQMFTLRCHLQVQQLDEFATLPSGLVRTQLCFREETHRLHNLQPRGAYALSKKRSALVFTRCRAKWRIEND